MKEKHRQNECLILALQHVVVCSVGWNVSLSSQLPVYAQPGAVMH